MAYTDSEQPDAPLERSRTPCTVCHDLRPEMASEDSWTLTAYQMRTGTWEMKYKDVLSSGQHGCKVCNVMLYAIERCSPQEKPERLLAKVRAKDDMHKQFFPFQLELFFAGEKRDLRASWEKGGSDGGDDAEEDCDRKGDEYYNPGIALQIYEEQDRPTGLRTGPARAVSRYPQSDECMHLLRSWLSNCCSNHKACSNPPDVTLPTRVIHIGSETSSPYLYLPKEGERGSYAALSHCWGGDVPLKTKNHNIQRHQAGIPKETLPATFQDALWIARQLQIPFLWIDSLCIIQDNEQDWNQESARMGSYYSGATLTIAADYAANSSKGCFKERPRKVWTSACIEKHQSGLPSNIHVRRAPFKLDNRLGHTFRPSRRKNDDTYFEGDPGSSLRKRAWTLQEWALSRRLVEFIDEEMVWECQQEDTCECSVVEDAEYYQSVLKTPVQRHDQASPALYQQWMSVVQEFSERSITKQTDRLPAISGIADVLSKATKDEYVCGIWKNSPSTLLWMPEKDEVPAVLRQTGFDSPSWSWASVATPLFRLRMYPTGPPLSIYDDPDFKCHAKILDIDWEPATLNPYGPVKYARLTVQGPVITGECRDLGDHPGLFFGGEHSSGLPRLDFAPHLLPGESFVVLVVHQHSDNGTSYVKGEGLVLKPVDESRSTYQRIGIYRDFPWYESDPEWRYAEQRTITLV